MASGRVPIAHKTFNRRSNPSIVWKIVRLKYILRPLQLQDFGEANLKKSRPIQYSRSLWNAIGMILESVDLGA